MLLCYIPSGSIHSQHWETHLQDPGVHDLLDSFGKQKIILIYHLPKVRKHVLRDGEI